MSVPRGMIGTWYPVSSNRKANAASKNKTEENRKGDLCRVGNVVECWSFWVRMCDVSMRGDGEQLRSRDADEEKCENHDPNDEDARYAGSHCKHG